MKGGSGDRARECVKLVNPQPRVASTLEKVGFSEALDIYPSVDAALAPSRPLRPGRTDASAGCHRSRRPCRLPTRFTLYGDSGGGGMHAYRSSSRRAHLCPGLQRLPGAAPLHRYRPASPWQAKVDPWVLENGRPGTDRIPGLSVRAGRPGRGAEPAEEDREGRTRLPPLTATRNARRRPCSGSCAAASSIGRSGSRT